MKKKYIIFFLGLLTLVISVFVFSACSGGEEGTPTVYKITFKANGEIVETIEFTDETESITPPSVPAKQCFTGEWEDYVFGPRNITVNAIYTPAHTLTKTEAVAAKCNQTGNIEYYTCSVCEGVFSDKDGKVTIPNRSRIVIYKVPCSYVDDICKWCGEKRPYTRDGQKITFGAYPQSLVKDSALKITLANKAGTLPANANSQSWTSYGYYLGGNVSDYMWYIDVEEGGERYRGVYFSSYRPDYVGSTTTETRNTHQDDNGYEPGNVYWFKYEPISWTILSENTAKKTALVLCDMIIDSQHYDNTSSNNYAESAIRKWLNETFYNTAFTELQKQLIVRTTVDNCVESTGFSSNPFACENTDDNIFLLSVKEASDSAYGLTSNVSRYKKNTDYAKAQGAEASQSTYGNYYGNGYWWLRSPADDFAVYACYVDMGGSITSKIVGHTCVGVVPALCIQFK